MLGQYLSRTVLGAFVFGVGISTGCAIMDPILDSQTQSSPAAGADSTEAGDGTDTQIVESPQSSSASSSESSSVSSKEAEIIARAKQSAADGKGLDSATTNSTLDQTEARLETTAPRELPVKDRMISEVRKDDLEGWEHRVRGIELISSGDWELARRHLEWAVELERRPQLANMLLEQLTANPDEYLGAESFSYQVKPGDKLADIAERYLGDPLKFPILARYNDIAVPQGMAENTVLRIPGDAPGDDTNRISDDAAPAANQAPESEETVVQPDSDTTLDEPGGLAKPGVEAVEALTDQSPSDAQSQPVLDTGQSEQTSSATTESTKALFSRAEYHYRLGEFEEAQQLVDKILNVDAGNVRARLMKGRLQERLN